MKKRISLFLAIVMVLTVMVSAIPVIAASQDTFSVANYADDTTFYITTAADLEAFLKLPKNFEGKTVELCADITLNDTTANEWYNAAGVKMLNDEASNYFQGTFDGNGHTIKGYVSKISSFSQWYKASGFFKATRGATIKDFTIDGFYIESTGAYATGALVGRMDRGSAVNGITLKNGTVMAKSVDTNESQRGGGVGTIFGFAYLNNGEAEIYKNVEIVDCKVDDSVKVISNTTGAYVGGIGGRFYADNNVGNFGINLTGSKIFPTDANLEALAPVAYFEYASGANAMTVKNDDISYSVKKWLTAKDPGLTTLLNDLIVASGAYELEIKDTFSVANYADDTTFYITTAADLEAFLKLPKNFEGKTVELCADITLNDTTANEWYNAAGVKMLNDEASNYFQGTFDGNGHTVKGYVSKISSFSQWYKASGFFKATRGATIKDFTIDGFYIESTGARATGALIGRMDRGSVITGVTLKNGTVMGKSVDTASTERGVGAIFGFANMNNGEAEIYKNVEIVDCKVDDSVKVSSDTTDAWVGSIGGRLYADEKVGNFCIDLTGSKIFSTDANGEVIDPIASFLYNSDTARTMTVKNDYTGCTNSQDVKKSNASLDILNSYIEEALTYWVEFLGLQMRASDNAARFVGLIKAPMNGEEVDLSQISSLGFEITVGDKTVGPDVIKCTKVYASILEDGNPRVAPEGYYYFTFVITGVSDNTTFDVRACATINGIDYSTAVGTCTYPPANS